MIREESARFEPDIPVDPVRKEWTGGMRRRLGVEGGDA